MSVRYYICETIDKIKFLTVLIIRLIMNIDAMIKNSINTRGCMERNLLTEH